MIENLIGRMGVISDVRTGEDPAIGPVAGLCKIALYNMFQDKTSWNLLSLDEQAKYKEGENVFKLAHVFNCVQSIIVANIKAYNTNIFE